MTCEIPKNKKTKNSNNKGKIGKLAWIRTYILMSRIVIEEVGCQKLKTVVDEHSTIPLISQTIKEKENENMLK